MSTKIYNGFRFKPDSFEGVMSLIVRWRSDIAIEAERLAGKVIAEHVTRRIDGLDMRPDSEPLSKEEATPPFRYIRNEFRDRIREIRKGYRDPEVDFGMDACIFLHDGKFYGVLNTEQGSWIDNWMSQEGVEDFSYWDNSDHPKDVSDDEWENRRIIWDRILGGKFSWRPSMAGVEATIFDREDIFRCNLLKATQESIPPLEERIANAAKEAVEADFWREYTAELQEDTSRVFSLLSEVNEKVRSDEGKLAIRARMNVVRSRLRPEITKADLLEAFERHSSPDQPSPKV